VGEKRVRYVGEQSFRPQFFFCTGESMRNLASVSKMEKLTILVRAHKACGRGVQIEQRGEY